MPEYRIALLGDCAIQHLATALRGYAFTCGLALNIYDADYNQILPQVMDPQSEMYAHKPDAVLIYMCIEMLYTLWTETPLNSRAAFADTVLARIMEYWQCMAHNGISNIIQFTFCEDNDFVFGNYACKQQKSFYIS